MRIPGFGNKQNQEALSLEGRPSWIKNIKKIGAKELIGYLRALPVHGVEYLLEFNQNIVGRYNLNTNINALQVLAGNYVVYAIDVSEKNVRFVMENVPFATPGATGTVDIDLTYVIDDAQTLFLRNMGDLEPEIRRRLERKVREVCIDLVPADYVKAQKMLQHVVLNFPFDFGVSIKDGLVVVQLPTDLASASLHGAQKEAEVRKAQAEAAIRDFTRGKLEFEQEVEFYGSDFPYFVEVYVAYERDPRRADAEDLMRRAGIVDPADEIRAEVKRTIRQTFLTESRSKSDMGDIEEATNLAVRSLVFDFGVRVARANIAIKKSAQHKTAQQREKELNELYRILREDGITGLYMRFAIYPELRETFTALIDNLRAEQAQLEARNKRLDDATFDKLHRAIKIGVIDREDLSDDQQQLVTQFLLGNRENATIGTGGQKLLGGNTPTNAPKLNDGAGEGDGVIRPRQKPTHNIDGITQPKPDAPWGPDDE